MEQCAQSRWKLTACLTASTPHLFLKNLDALVKASLRNHQTSKEAKSSTPPTRTQVVVEGDWRDDIFFALTGGGGGASLEKKRPGGDHALIDIFAGHFSPPLLLLRLKKINYVTHTWAPTFFQRGGRIPQNL